MAGRCNASQDAQDAWGAGDASLASGRNADGSDAGSVFADVGPVISRERLSNFEATERAKGQYSKPSSPSILDVGPDGPPAIVCLFFKSMDGLGQMEVGPDTRPGPAGPYEVLLLHFFQLVYSQT